MIKIDTVLMTRTERGSPDGGKVRTYHNGVIYNLPEDLAEVFVTQLKCAVYCDGETLSSDTQHIVPPWQQ